MFLHFSSPSLLPRLHQHQMHRDASWSSGPRWLFISALLWKHLATWGYTNSCCMLLLYVAIQNLLKAHAFQIRTVPDWSFRFPLHITSSFLGPYQRPCQTSSSNVSPKVFEIWWFAHSKLWKPRVQCGSSTSFWSLLHVYLQFIYFGSAFPLSDPAYAQHIQPFESLV